MAAEDAAPRSRPMRSPAAVPASESVPVLASASASVPALASASASGSPFAALDRLRSASGSASSGSAGGPTKPRRPKKKKKKRPQQSLGAKTELTPLLIAKPEEEVHPLPWFRSPEWTRRSPPGRPDARRARRRGAERPAAASARWWLCCLGADNGAETESDLEMGVLLPPPKDAAAAINSAGDADGFKQCIQFLVGLIVLVAIALILLIIFQPRALPPGPHKP